MKWRSYAVLVLGLTLVASSVAQDEELDEHEDGPVVMRNDGEDVVASLSQYPNSKMKVEITEDDLKSIKDNAVPEQVKEPTAGEDYVPEESSYPESEAHNMYKQAMRYLEQGKGHGDSAKAAAYKLLSSASSLGHKDAMKLVAFAHLFGDKDRWSLDEARRLFEQLAVGGSADAQLGLGFMHATGLGMPKSDQAKALVYYMFSALGGNPLAQMAMGYRYLQGIGVAQNCESAMSYYQKAAEKVVDNVRFSTGLTISRIRLTDEAEPTVTNAGNTPLDPNTLEYYRFLADKGDPSAQVGLGQLCLSGGRGVEQNFELAQKYFAAAAEQGNPNAFAYLGKMYLDGTHATPQSNSTAFHFFLKSADKGSHIGQAGLGIMYLQGRGVRHDLEKAYRLFALSAEQGWVDGQLYLGEMYYKGIGVKRDFKQAIKYYHMATQNGHVLAYYNLAQMHAAGVGVPRSCSTAVEFFKSVAERGRWGSRMMEAYFAYKAKRVDEAAFKYMFMAELGYEQAQTNIAHILDRNEASSFFNEKDENQYERALVHWQRSASQDYPIARIKLGDYHYYGLGTPQDHAQAALQYKIAVDRHLMAQAMFNLGIMYEQGEGLTRDLHLAKRYYDQAAEQSADAAVPVALALFKLAILFAGEQFARLPVIQALESVVGPDWDLLIMAIVIMILLVCLVKFMMRIRMAYRQPLIEGDEEELHLHQD